MWVVREGPSLGQPPRGWILATNGLLIHITLFTSRVQGSMQQAG